MKAKLELVREQKLYKLLPGRKKKSPLEASGVTVLNGNAYVIFDSLNLVGKVNPSLKSGRSNRLIPALSPGTGFEDITFDPQAQRFYLIIEAEEDTDGKYRSFVVEYDHEFRFQRCTRLSKTFESKNKGFEGLAHLWRGKKEYLLAMCEGNLCTAATEGGGRIQVFVRTKEENWQWTHQIALPDAAEFEDYAAISFHGDRLAVVSQASSRLWIGDIDRTAHAFAGDGITYRFPDKGYCNVEGVDWLSDDLLVVVSDRMKADKQAKRCAAKDQSIHVFRIPESKALATKKKTPAKKKTTSTKKASAGKRAQAKKRVASRKKTPVKRKAAAKRKTLA
ncbi:MAG: hypothetical protein JSU95_08815 [Betaproteobacteria bacterium]|nr:MAG: hypothetical protein JSU95_08815 [Betaproteobacteria bacterium]